MKELNTGFTVTRPGGTKDAEFQTYARLLRQQGVDLGKVPRVRDPNAALRWLHVWPTQPEAQGFADALKEQTRDPNWRVVAVNGPISEGPLGPVVIQMVRQGDGLTFGLHLLSRAMVRSAFPGTASAITYATTDTATWNEFKKTKRGIRDLVRKIIPALTDLTPEQLASLGYAVVDADTDETMVFVPPAAAVPG